MNAFQTVLRYRTWVNVLVVDDHDELSELLLRSLATDGHSVVPVGSAAAARDALSTQTFDVIVLDIGLPDGSGLDLCRRVRQDDVPTPILILTARASVSERVEGLDAGADDFMGKPFAVAELRARVRALGRRKGQPATLEWASEDVALDFPRRRALRNQKEVQITTREWAILAALASARGRVVKQSQIL